jgi:mRNA interferase MazF
VLILTRSTATSQLSNVTIAPLTRTIHNVESEVILSPEEGLPSVCAVSLENILTIRKSSLDRRIARLSVNTMKQVFEALRFTFAMP